MRGRKKERGEGEGRKANCALKKNACTAGYSYIKLTLIRWSQWNGGYPTSQHPKLLRLAHYKKNTFSSSPRLMFQSLLCSKWGMVKIVCLTDWLIDWFIDWWLIFFFRPTFLKRSLKECFPWQEMSFTSWRNGNNRLARRKFYCFKSKFAVHADVNSPGGCWQC